MAHALPFTSAARSDGSFTPQTAGAILPAGFKAFVYRRLIEIFGVVLIVAGVLLGTSILSYTPGDPSLNSSGGGVVGNLLGRPGAFSADLMLQGFGLAGLLPVVALIVWGWRVMCKRVPSHPWIRVAALLFAMVFAAIGFDVLPVAGGWPLAAPMGGVAGMLCNDYARLGGTLLMPGFDHAYVAGAAAVLAIVFAVTALGLTWRDWRAGAVATVRAATALGRGAKRTRAAFGVVPAWPGKFGQTDRSEPAAEDEVAEIDLHVAVGTGPAAKMAGQARTGLVAAKKPRPKTGKKAKAARQGKLELVPTAEYQPPPLELLEAPVSEPGRERLNKDALQQNARFLATVLEDFGVKGEIVKVRPGPVVTLYELEPAPGTKTSRVIGLSDDIARSMSAVSVRVAVVPGRNVIGVELPNVHREMVYLRELLGSDAFEKTKAKLPLALGKDIGGTPVTVDLSRMPHLLIAGTTGSGKSVAMNTMILSLLHECSPEQCKFIMIDPKMLELSVYEGIPHLLTGVVTEPAKAVVALKWTVREMEDRYRAMSQLGVRNIAGYNARVAEARKKGEVLSRRVQTGFDDDGKPVIEEQPLSTESLPFIVVVVDEMADLMLVAGKDVEATIQRLAQMARAAGIHLIMATQRPSVDVITGTIKANFPTRVSFQVTSKIDSRTILGEQGAEQLLGQGDMLYMEGGGRITRVHGPFVSDEDVEQVVKHLKTQGEPIYIEDVTEEEEQAGPGGGASDGDALYDEAVALIAREGKASTSFIQRHLQIGYNRAARIIEQMEREGVVSPANRVGRREVLVGSH